MGSIGLLFGEGSNLPLKEGEAEIGYWLGEMCIRDRPEIVEDWQSGTKYATVTDRLVQTITDPPLSDGWLDGEELRAFLQSRYQFTSAQPDGMLKEVRFAVSRDGKAVEGIDTTQPGEYLIAYTLEDSAGNRTSLFLRYRLQEGEISGEPVSYTHLDVYKRQRSGGEFW